MEKQLIILSHHVYVGNSSPEQAKAIMAQTVKTVTQDDNDPQYRYKHFFHPVKEEMNARTVCIFPNN